MSSTAPEPTRSPTPARAIGSTAICRRACGRICACRAPTGRSAPGCCYGPACGALRWPLPVEATAIFPIVQLIALFAIGAAVMRGAGCTYNDIVDRDIDAKVARTASRPLPSGKSVFERAIAWMVLQRLHRPCSCSSPSTRPTIRLGLGALCLFAAYPFMKRITYWPQIWLGLTFNWGALLGWTAVTGTLGAPAFWLYAGGIFWTIGYDTIYAHQDKEDDALIGVKSTRAIKLAERTKFWLRIFYGVRMARLSGRDHQCQ